MDVADVLSRRSRCCRAQVGAVIVTEDNRANSLTYNGPARGDKVEGDCSNWCPRVQNDDHSSDYGTCRSIHAEMNAIARADWSDVQGATIYVTGSMCINCAKAVANSGIVRVVHRVSDDRAYRQPEAVEDYLRSVGIDVERSTV